MRVRGWVGNFVAVTVAVMLMTGCGKVSGTPQEATSATSGATSAGATSAGATPAAPPLAAGRHLVASVPSGVEKDHWGDVTQVASEPDGTVVVVFIHVGIGGDEDKGEVLVARWTPADRSWSAPASIYQGEVTGSDGAPIALAEDPATGALAVAVADPNRSDQAKAGVKLLWSTDRGASWSTVTVAKTLDTSDPAVAVDGTAVVVGYLIDDSVHLATAAVSGGKVGDFTDKQAPGTGAHGDTKPWTPAVALSGGHPVIAYYGQDGDNADLVTWDGAAAAPTKVFDSAGTGPDDAVTALASAGGTLVVASSMTRSDADDAPIAYVGTSADGGAHWNGPTPVPADGDSDPFGLGLALLTGGGAALAYSPNSGNDSQQCDSAKLAISPDLTTWGGCLKPAAGAQLISDTNSWPGVTAGPDGGALLAYAVQESDDGGPKPGVYVQVFAKADLHG